MKRCRRRLKIEDLPEQEFRERYISMDIRLYDTQDGVTKLGPGIRFVIWTQGCLRRCPGCMTPDSQPLDTGYSMDIPSLAKIIIKSGRSGLTISGGEPFLQAKAVLELVSLIRKERDIGVIIYTGYTIDEIKESADCAFHQLLSVCDLLIDGEYIDELNDGKNLRGSLNQKVIAITNRYIEYVSQYGSKPAEVEFFFQEDKISMVGIPTHDMLERFKEIKF